MSFDFVKNKILINNNISIEEIFSVLSDISKRNINYSDIYFQSKFNECWILEDKIIKNGTYNINKGIGLRAISNEMTSFAYVDQITSIGLHKIARSVKNVLDKGFIFKNKNFISKKHDYFYDFSNPLNSLSNKEKIDILYQVDKFSRQYDSRIYQVSACLNGTYEYVLIASTDGVLETDIRPLVSLSIKVLSEDRGKREVGTYGGGIRGTYKYFLKKNKDGVSNIKKFSEEAARISILNLFSKEAPSGFFPVVLGSGLPGVLIHEAVGHGLEGDFNRKKLSVYSDKLEKKIASNLCTIIDDGTKKNFRGSISIDDEGTPGQYNVLIKNGVLKKYLQDKFNSYLTNTNSTGNGRRESYSSLPIPRMTNTYMLPGKSTKKEIIESVDYGIYAVSFIGGQVDITSGEFVFSASEAYLINKGKIIHPIKGVTLIGSGIEIMNKISMVGNDLFIENGTGICVKEGQEIPVCVGQPTIKIDNLTIGGTK
ncbi:MAG: metalloprotease TldD [Buchnera aphidicola (Periphyllus lyropictus)]|uniref:metalloprotease TldD n=1 Tax=Buchnera aphidicola TaxID=9 RepID=UPI001ECD3E2B|nr:metalloprotease TldD [Buchnera aphidicola]NIH16557.1 metalloprotease TldD [Buchnera aphidicola (Periphyllus lyropictus)]USS94450.1 metalloprotease TldD [Buchnera aphidicola (Periphyllus lyropictus)]